MTRRCLTAGDDAPDFELPTCFGGRFHLYKTLLNSPVVLFLHVRAFTPICSSEVFEEARIYYYQAVEGDKQAYRATQTLFSRIYRYNSAVPLVQPLSPAARGAREELGKIERYGYAVA